MLSFYEMNCLLEKRNLLTEAETPQEIAARIMADYQARKSAKKPEEIEAKVETPPVNAELLAKLQHAPTDPARKKYEIPRAPSRGGSKMSQQLPVTSSGSKEANRKMYLTQKIEDLNKFLPNWHTGRWAIYKALKGTPYFDRLPSGYDPDDTNSGKPPVFVLAMYEGGSAQNVWQGATDDPSKHDPDKETSYVAGKGDVDVKQNFSKKETWMYPEVIIDDPEFVEKLIPEIYRKSQGLSKEDEERLKAERKASNNPVRNKNYVETIANYAIKGMRPNPSDPTQKQIVVNKELIPIVSRALKFEKELDDPNLVDNTMRIKEAVKVLSSKALRGGTKELDNFLNIVTAMFSGSQDVVDMPDPLEYSQIASKYSSEELDLEAMYLLIRAAKRGGFPFLTLVDGDEDDPSPYDYVKISPRGLLGDDPMSKSREGLSSMSHEDMAAAKSKQISAKSLLDKAMELMKKNKELPKKEATEWMDLINIMENSIV